MSKLKKAIKLLKECRDVFQKENERLQKIIRKSPQGSLVIRKPSGKRSVHYFWQTCTSGKVSKTYLSTRKQFRTIQKLSDKKYAKTSSKNLSATLKAINLFLSNCPDNDSFGISLADKLAKQYYIFSSNTTITKSEYQEKWKNSFTEFLHFHDSDKIHTNEDGCKYRSKSESMIATELRAAGITYVYDAKKVLPTGKVIYVDFVLLHPETLEEIYLEHFGKFDDPEYMEDINERLIHYRKSGILHGGKFFFTHETRAQPLTKDHILDVIDSILNCC